MTSGNLNAVLPDHLPSCPRCGSLCGRLARLCADCGMGLYEQMKGDDRMIRDKLHGRAPSGEQEQARVEQP